MKSARIIGVLALGFGLSISTSARADARSDALIAEGISLSEAGKYTEACPKFADAVKIDPALNTQINLAECYDRIGKTGRAYATWVQAEQIAKTTGRTKEAAKAHERVAALEPTVPRLKITLPAGSTGAVVKVDGKKIANDAIASIAVDPGEHAVDVTAPGKKAWHDDVNVQAGALLVEVPPFVAPGAEKPPEHYEAMRPSSGFRIAGATIAGVGAVVVVIGIVSGTNALRSRDEARASCGEDDPKKCHSQAGVEMWRDAKSSGSLSTIAFLAGGALVIGGAVLWIAAPNRPVVSGSIDPNNKGAGLRVSGVF